MKNLEELNRYQVKVMVAKKEMEDCKKAYLSAKLKLEHLSSDLVSAREAVRKAQESLDEYVNTKVGETSLDDHFDKEVREFKERLPDLLKKIEAEPTLPYKSIADLELGD